MTTAQALLTQARKDAQNLQCEYDAVFREVIWDRDMAELAQITPNRFVLAVTQCNIFQLMHLFRQHGYKVYDTVELEYRHEYDGIRLQVYGVVMERVEINGLL